MNDNKRKLYDALSQDYDLGTFEQFESDIADAGKRRKLYDATIEEYDFGDFAEFENQLGFAPQAQSAPQAVAAPQPAPQVEVEPQQGFLGKAMDRITDAVNEAEEMENRVEEQLPDMNERMKQRVLQGQTTQGAFERFRKGDNYAVEGTPEYDWAQRTQMRNMFAKLPEEQRNEVVSGARAEFRAKFGREAQDDYEVYEWMTGGKSVRPEYATEDTPADDIAKYNGYSANEIKAGWGGENARNEYMRDTLIPQLESAAEKTDTLLKSREETVKSRYWKDYEKNAGTPGLYPELTMWGEGRAMDDEWRYLKAADNINKETKMLIDAAKNDRGFWRGFGRRISDLDTWIPAETLLEYVGAKDLMNIDPDKATSGQKALMEALALRAAAEEQYEGDVRPRYKAGETVAEMIPLAAEMLVNPLSGTGKAAAKATMKKVAKKEVKKKIAGEAAEKALKKWQKKFLIKSAGYAGSMAGGYGMAATTSLPKVAINAGINSVGRAQYEVGKDGVGFSGFKPGESYGKEFLKEFGRTTFEHATEQMGAEWLSKLIGKPLGWIGKGVMKIPGAKSVTGKVGDLLDNKVGDALKKLAKDVNYQGPIEEFGEEFVSALHTASIDGMDSLKKWFEGDNLETTAIAVTMPALLGLGASVTYGAVDYERGAKAKSKQMQAYKEGFEAFADMPEDWKTIVINLNSPSGIIDEMKRIYNDPIYTDKQKIAALMYGARTMAWMGTEGVKGVNTDENVLMLNEMLGARYREGYEQEPTGENAVKEANEYTDARNEVVKILGLAEDADVDAMLEGRTAEEIAMGDTEVEDAVNNYIQARARRDGFRERYQEERDRQFAESDRSVDERTNNGTVYGVATENGEAFITSGTVVLNEEGEIDYANSEGLVVMFPDGTKKPVQRGSLPGKVTVQNAEDLKAAGRTAIEERWRAELESAENAYVEQQKRAEGVVFDITDKEGTHRVEVVKEGDEMSSILVDGEQMQISTEMLNALRGEAGVTQAENGNVEGENEVQPVVAPGDEVQSAMELTPAQTELPKEKQAVASIPTEKRGKEERAAYHMVPIERTMEDLHDGTLEPDEIVGLIDARIKEAESDVKAVENKKPVIGADKNAYVAAKQQWQADMEAAKAKLDYYNNLKAVNAEVTRSEMREAVEGVQPQVLIEQTVDEFVANLLGGWIKITPESFQKETGLKAEQKQMVGVIAGKDKGGMTIEQAAETILENYGDELRGLGFNGDMQDMRDMIIDILSKGNPRSYAKKGAEMRAQESVEQQRSELESVAHGLNFNSIEEQIEYEETVVPKIIQDYTGFDEQEYFNNLAENYEYDTTREGEGTRGGSELLQGEQTADNARVGDITEPGQRGKVQGDVYSGGENAASQGNQQQVSSPEVPSTGDTTSPVEANAEGRNAPGQSGVQQNESGKMYSSEELAEAKEQLGELNATSAPEFAARLFSIKPWKTLEEANAALKELLASYGETLNGQSLAVMPFLDKAQGLIREYNKSQELGSVEEVLENGDKRITNYNSRGEVATVATERDGKVVSVDSYDEGVLFEHTEYDTNGVSTSVTRYDKNGNVVSTQVFENSGVEKNRSGKQSVTDEVLAMANKTQQARFADHAKSIAEKLGVVVTVHNDESAVTNRDAMKAIDEGGLLKGWYNPNTGEIALFLPAMESMRDVESTILHEAVSHYGIKHFLGKEDFDKFLDGVWDMMSAGTRAYYLDYVGADMKNPSQEKMRQAADEYVAHIAEKMDLNELEKSVWQRFIDYVMDVLRKAGFKNLKQRDVEAVIRASYANLRQNGGNSQVTGQGETMARKKMSERRQEKNRINNVLDEVGGIIYGNKEYAKKQRLKREAERKELAKEIYSSVLKGDFNDVTLSQIDKFIEDATPANPFGRRISQRLPQRMERALRQGARANAVDALFSRISESAVPANERFSEAGRRKIEERKKELLKGWAIATGNWHTDLKEFTDDTEPIGEGKDSKVYSSKDGRYVIKASKGKPFGKRFRPDIDNIALFNDVFRDTRYEILGYGEIDGEFVRILQQPIVDFAESTPLTSEERREYMQSLGFEPLNDANTAFADGEIVIADLQKGNVVRDAAGNISVIDADAKLHTKDVGGDYTYPPVETDLPEGTDLGGTMFRKVTPEMDAEYMAAVENGDMETAERLVKEAAKLAMPDTKVVDEDGYPMVVYHGSANEFTVFGKDVTQKRAHTQDNSYFFTGDKAVSEDYGDVLYGAYLNLRNPLVVDFEGRTWRNTRETISVYYARNNEVLKSGFASEEEAAEWREQFLKDDNAYSKDADYVKVGPTIEQVGPSTDEYVAKAQAEGYDGLVIENVVDAAGGGWVLDENNRYTIRKTAGADIASTDFVAFAPNQIKSADAVTYDDKGNVISLNERFNEEKEDIRFRKVFHGSGAKFDRFDHSHMGEGEGAQIYGWGTYVSEVEGIGRAYANSVTANRGAHIAYNGKPLLDVIDGMGHWWKVNKNRLASAGSAADLRSIIEGLRIGENANERTAERFEQQRSELLAAIDNGEISVGKPRNLYTVEIPDDNGSNYLHWEKRIPMNVVNSIKKRLFDILAEGDYKGAEKELKRELDDVFKAENNDGYLIYGNISAYLGGDKAASQFLNDMGFVGISYPAEATTGGRADGARNYVIFNENDAKIEDRTMFRFIGKKGAENLDKAEEATTRLDNLNVAREMETAGKDAKAIKLATGWERGADRKWKYETEDAKVNRAAKLYNLETRESYPIARSIEIGRVDDNSTIRLTDLVKDDELFETYPEMEEYFVSFEKMDAGIEGSHIFEEKMIRINKDDIHSLESTLVHEIQHAIQSIEGFAKGGNTSSSNGLIQEVLKTLHVDSENAAPSLSEVISAIENGYITRSQHEELVKIAQSHGYDDVVEYVRSLSPYSYYRRLAGEVESRNVEERLGMSPEERRNKLAEETEDVRREDQIFLEKNLGESAMGTNVVKRRGNIASHYAGQDLTSEQKDLIAAFEGTKNDAVLNVVDSAGQHHHITMKQGNENRAGIAHSILYHFETRTNNYTADEILLIPEIIKNGIQKKSGNKIAYEYSANGVTYTVTTVIKNRNEEFTNFFTDRKPAVKRPLNTASQHGTSSQPVSADKSSTSSAEMQEGETLFRRAEQMGEDEVVLTGNAVAALGEKLNIPARVVNDVESLLEKRKNKKGWFENGEVVVVLPNHVSMEDAMQTVLHEVVGRKGLRAVMGDEFDALLDVVYKNLPKGVKSRINYVVMTRFVTPRQATEEYIAGLARKNSQDAVLNDIMQRMGDYFRGAMNLEVEDGELQYMLWKNNQRLQTPDVLSMLQDFVMETETNTGDNGTRFRVVNDTATDAYEKNVRGWWNKVKEGHYDRLRSVRKAQEAIADETGMPISDSEDVYSYAEHLPSINKIMKEQFDNKFLTPFIKLLKRIYDVEFNGKKLDEKSVERYTNAKHGLERNRDMAVANALTTVEEVDGKKKPVFNKDAYEDWQTKKAAILAENITWEEKQDKLDALAKTYGAKLKDYSGLTAIFDPEGKMKYKQLRDEAIKYVTEMEGAVGKKSINELWKIIKGMTDFSLKQSYESGLLSKDMYESISKRYEFYVPLRGFTEETAEDYYDYLAADHTPLNSVIKRAEGRKSEADNIFATILNMANSAIVFGNKNRLKQRVLNLATRHKSSLLSVDRAWYEKKGEDVWELALPVTNENMTEEQLAQAYADFEADMKRKEALGEARRQVEGLNIKTRVISDQNKAQHAIRVKRNGREYIVWVNASPTMANAVNGMLREEETGWVLDKIDTINKLRSKMVTQFSPTFVLTNLFRDVQGASTVYGVRYGAKALGQFEMNVMGNSVKMMGLYAKFKKGTLDESVPLERYFKEFLENGGETGYTEMISIEEYNKALNKLTEKLNIKNATGRALEAAGEGVEFANRCVENLCRFSAYMTSRENGMSILQSVNDAKEVSVNFNRKGSGAMGAGVAKRLFMFYNPAVQALAQRYLLAKNYPKRMIPVLAGEFALGAMQPILFATISALASSAFGDDDDETWEEKFNRAMGRYYNLTDYRRRGSVCLPLDDGVFNPPLAHESRVFFGLGELAMSLYNGHETYDNILAQAMDIIGQSLPLNPVEGWAQTGNLTESLLLNLTPDALKPFAENAVNRDFAGNKIHNASDMNAHLPEYMRGKKSTAEIYNRISKLLSGGESDFERGLLDKNASWLVNPSKLEHLVEGYLGGAYTFAEKLVRSASWAMGNEENADARNIPFVSSFYTPIGKYEETPSAERTRRDWERAFDYYQGEMKLLDGKEKAAKRGLKFDMENAAETLEAMQGGEALMVDVFNDGNKVLKELYADIDAARTAKDFDKVKEIDQEIYAQKRFITERMEQMAENPMIGYTFNTNKSDDEYGQRETYGDVRDMNVINEFQRELKPLFEAYVEELKTLGEIEQLALYQKNEKMVLLYNTLKRKEQLISNNKEAMKVNPEKADEYMDNIRRFRAEAIDLINNYNE